MPTTRGGASSTVPKWAELPLACAACVLEQLDEIADDLGDRCDLEVAARCGSLLLQMLCLKPSSPGAQARGRGRL